MAAAVANIELYEELKKSLTEEAARMIAEVFPAGADVATRGDIARLELAIARLESKMGEMSSELKSYIDSRLLRYTATVVIPICTMLLGAIIAFVIKI